MKTLKFLLLVALVIVIVGLPVYATEDAEELVIVEPTREDAPSLKLTTQDLTVRYGEEIDPNSLILLGFWDTLELPRIDTTQLGSQTLHFIARSDGGEVRASLDLLVLDDTPPVFDEEISTLSLEYNEDVELLDYFQASDNAGGIVLLTTSQDIDNTSPGKQTITVTATDESGNIATKDVVVTVKEKPKPKPVYVPSANYDAAAIAASAPAEAFNARVTIYGVDCYGCYMNSEGVGGTSSGVRLSLSAVRQADGTWVEGITYQGRYILAADRQYPFCTLVDIYNHGYAGQGITPDQPIRGIVLDRGGAIYGNHFDLFIGSEANRGVYHVASTQPRAVVVGYSSNCR